MNKAKDFMTNVTSVAHRAVRALCCATTCVWLLGGCAEKEEIGVIRGQVTYQGQPVTDATLFFRNYDRGIHIMAELDDQGGYQVFTAGGKGLPLGEYVVCLSPNEPALDVDPETGQIRRTAGSRKPRKDVPQRYQDAKTSPLSVVVAPGENQFDVALTD